MASELGTLIRDTRIALGLGLRDFAKRIEKSPTFVVKLECEGEFPPASEDTLRRVASILELDPDRVLTLAGRTPADVRPESSLEVALYRAVKDLPETRQRALLEQLRGDAA